MKEMAFSTYYEVIAYELHDALVRYNDRWLEILCKDEAERGLWLVPVEQRRLSVLILTCCLLENVINFYLSTKCQARDFEKIEKFGFIKKWTEAPKLFVPNYSLPAQSELAKDLTQLRNRRVALVHPQPMMSIDGDKRHKGNEPTVDLDEHEFIGRCASLPFRLVDHLLVFDNAFMQLSSLRIVCGTVDHTFRSGQYAINRLARVPLQLVTEIQAQGHRPEEARMFAALIGEFPMPKADGTIPVLKRRKEIARLQPLSFFSAGCPV